MTHGESQPAAVIAAWFLYPRGDFFRGEQEIHPFTAKILLMAVEFCMRMARGGRSSPRVGLGLASRDTSNSFPWAVSLCGLTLSEEPTGNYLSASVIAVYYLHSFIAKACTGFLVCHSLALSHVLLA